MKNYNTALIEIFLKFFIKYLIYSSQLLSSRFTIYFFHIPQSHVWLINVRTLFVSLMNIVYYFSFGFDFRFTFLKINYFNPKRQPINYVIELQHYFELKCVWNLILMIIYYKLLYLNSWNISFYSYSFYSRRRIIYC